MKVFLSLFALGFLFVGCPGHPGEKGDRGPAGLTGPSGIENLVSKDCEPNQVIRSVLNNANLVIIMCADG